jgi:secondary thiamine-phosphate synthase enzyme
LKIYTEEISIETSRRRELINISSIIQEKVSRSKIRNGIILVFLPHATAAIIANEDEPLIRKDYMKTLEKIAPENDRYEHNRIDNNADAHILSMILKQFYIFPIVNGKIVRGTWQDPMLVELDGPRHRRLVIVVIGE